MMLLVSRTRDRAATRSKSTWSARPLDTSSNSYVSVLPDEKSVRPAAAYLRVSTRGASRSVNLLAHSLLTRRRVSSVSGDREA